MSADNGWVLRKNLRGEFVLQMFFASVDDYPAINAPSANTFKTLEEALVWYENEAGYSEYGLTAHLQTVTHDEPIDGYHEHLPVLHLGDTTPWCNVCGLTVDLEVPESRFEKMESTFKEKK